jgi:hypothetical protein
VLCLQQPAYLQSIERDSFFRQYVVKYHEEVFQHVTRTLGKRVKKADIIYVTGHVKASGWATCAFRSSSANGSITSTGGIASLAQLSATMSRSSATSSSRPALWGPQPRTSAVRQEQPAPPHLLSHGAAPSARPSAGLRRPHSIEQAILCAQSSGVSDLGSIRFGMGPAPYDVDPWADCLVPNQNLVVEGFRLKERLPVARRRSAALSVSTGHTVGPDVSVKEERSPSILTPGIEVQSLGSGDIDAHVSVGSRLTCVLTECLSASRRAGTYSRLHTYAQWSAFRHRPSARFARTLPSEATPTPKSRAFVDAAGYRTTLYSPSMSSVRS